MMFGFVDPGIGLGILISVKMLIMAALGGAGTLFGPLVGAAILVPLEERPTTASAAAAPGLTFVLYGAIIVLIARFEPGGLLELWQRIAPRAARSKTAGRAAMLLEARENVVKAFGSLQARSTAPI
jgi:branched-chain amino acid transport system permease protein